MFDFVWPQRVCRKELLLALRNQLAKGVRRQGSCGRRRGSTVEGGTGVTWADISEEAPELSGEGAAREDLLDLGVQQLLKNLLREKLPLEPQRTFLKTIKGSTHCRPCQSGRAEDTCDGRRHLSRTFVRPCSRNSGDSRWGSFFRGTQFSRNSLSRIRSS